MYGKDKSYMLQGAAAFSREARLHTRGILYTLDRGVGSILGVFIRLMLWEYIIL